MKRRTLTLSAVAAAVVIGAGTATTVAFAGEADDDTSSAASRSSVRAVDDDDRDDADSSAGSGAGSGADSDGRDDDRRENAREARDARVSAEEAVAAALRHTPGTATEVDLDSDDGRLVWDVDVLSGGKTWHHVVVDPGTGKVLGAHVEPDDDDDDDSARRVSSALRGTSTSAADAARAAAGRGAVTSVELDDDAGSRGRAWEVETTSPSGVERHWHVSLTGTTPTPAYDD
ncbi:peptidase propeptide and YpeB domain protein [Streptomyces sp. SID5785]|uniref:PepSY domain-containing protein n=1 Tax=Streptomyces sp. SID5785 TaxID=2690309 RepID=UPI0013616D74|nr:PepSY domain-containing protein [Streptomyces sp. SID5785]MZD05521.1 peptidase propeptide and YpeB domain protein [Streptomyces sp. SID5785]